MIQCILYEQNMSHDCAATVFYKLLFPKTILIPFKRLIGLNDKDLTKLKT